MPLSALAVVVDLELNSPATITFHLLNSSNIKITIYNILGQPTRKLVAEEYVAGTHSVKWDGRDNFGSDASSGVYFYRILAGDFTASKKMILIR